MQATLQRLHERRREMGDEGGFTLIELLIVIVILGILAAIVVFAVQNLSKSSSKASCGSDVKTVETAAEAFKAQVGSYPNSTLPTGVGIVTTGAVTTTPAGDYKAGTDAGVIELLNTYTLSGGAQVGPWLKDVPANPSHYAVGVSNDGKGTILIYNGTGTSATVAGCSNITN